jgi:hypothetical protein
VSESEQGDRPVVDESKFDRHYVPDHLKERVANWRGLSVPEKMELVSELSLAAWAKIGVYYDPNRPSNRQIRRMRWNEDGELEPY